MPHAGAGGNVVGKRAGVSRSLAKLPVCAREVDMGAPVNLSRIEHGVNQNIGVGGGLNVVRVGAHLDLSRIANKCKHQSPRS